MSRKLSELIKFAKDCLDTITYLYVNEVNLHRYFAIHHSTESSFNIRHGAHSIYFHTKAEDRLAHSMFEKGKTDYILFRSDGSDIKYISHQRGKAQFINHILPYITDLTDENYFQNSLIYNDSELKAMFILSYFKKYSEFQRISFEFASMKHFIKQVRILKNADKRNNR
ncbi:TPA: hypothetical protein OGU99_000561 [Escherichia coli]|nr:hypothetical protein [Escherichia coli O157]USL83450.1 hypothetical protein A4_374 [Escherichia phage A4]HCQ0858635.1 hypothetical protein [Escherichia coli]